ncbi:MAG TPA: iron ABC transporter permease [Candidatus Limnocylindria bacterium]|nr:iron ABC transporter permease [Candidatus Limnocylindria bacterium]
MLSTLRREPAAATLAVIAAAGIALVILYPFASVLQEAILHEGGLDASPVTRVIANPVTRQIVVNTLLMGVLAGLFGTILGLAFALATTRAARGPLRTLLHYAALLPLIAPPFALALSTIFLFGRNGLISKQLFGLEVSPYGLGGLLFVQTITFFPVAYLIFDALVRQMDPALEEAALNLGASRGRILRTVTLPLLRPGFAGAFLIIFVESLADLANPLLIGGDFNVLASSVYLAIIGEYDTRKAVGFAAVLLVPSLVAFFIQRLWVGEGSVVTVTGKPSTGRVAMLESWIRAGLLGVTLFTTAIVASLYLAVVAGAFTKLLGINNTLTLDNFRFVLQGIGTKAMTDTTLLSAIAAPIAGVSGLLVAWLVVRSSLRGRIAFDYLVMLGAAAPGIVLGLGLLLAFNHPPFRLTGQTAIFGGAVVFIIAFIIRTAPVSLRGNVAALMQIDPALEQASANLGAGEVTTFRRVTVPLVRRAVLSGVIFSFTRNMTTLSTVALLVTPSWRIMTSQILNEIDAQRLGSGAAYSTILIVIVLVAIVALQKLFGRTAVEVAA